MISSQFWRFILVLALPQASLATPTAADLAVKFGAREEFYGVSLSPDGGRISYLNPIERKTNALMVVDLATGIPKPIVKTSDANAEITGCSWAKIDRLMCRAGIVTKLAGYVGGSSMLVSVDPNNGETKIFPRMGYLDNLPDDPDNILLANGSLTVTNVVKKIFVQQKMKYTLTQ